jgi:AcrR family transcriptional regulator
VTSRGRDTLDRRTVIEVAADLADREGWRAVTLSRVAREVDRHVTSLYTHVDSVEGLRRDVALLALEELGDRLWQAALGRSGEDALVALAHVYRDYQRERPGRGLATLNYWSDNDAGFMEAGLRAAEPLRATLRSFGLDGVQVVHAHRAFTAAVRGFSVAEAAGQYRDEASAAETFDQIVALFVTALRSGKWPSEQT